MIAAFVLSAIFVSVCVVVVCAARCGGRRDKRSSSVLAGRQQRQHQQPEVAAIDSPLMMTSQLTSSDSLMTSDRQLKNQVCF